MIIWHYIIEYSMKIDRKLKLLFIPKDNRGSGFYRIFLPASKLKDLGLAEVRLNNRYDPAEAQWADVIVVQRPTEIEWLERFITLKSEGKKVVLEIDDLLYGIDPRATAWDYWNPVGANLGRALILMQNASAITTTTARLRNEYALHNRHIHVLPNYLPPEKWDKPVRWTNVDWDNYKKRKNDETIRIGWVGAANHVVDLELVAGIVDKICKDNPNVHFVLMGPTAFKGMFPSIQEYNPETGEGQLELIKGVDLQDYPDVVHSLALDIAIAPLAEISFNECKSDLKLKEYGAISVPTVASNMKPYSLSLLDGKTGYLATTGKEWYDCLTKLIKDKDLRDKMGTEARKFYEANTIDGHIKEWLQVYDELINVKYEW